MQTKDASESAGGNPPTPKKAAESASENHRPSGFTDAKLIDFSAKDNPIGT